MIRLVEQILINAYGYSNLQVAVLAHFYADQLAQEPNPVKGLYGFRNDVRRHLESTVFPPNDPDSEKIRSVALSGAVEFFRQVRDILVRRNVIELKDCAL